MLGIICDQTLASGILTDPIALPAFKYAIPIIVKLSLKYGLSPLNTFSIDDLVDSSGIITVGHLESLLVGRQRRCLSTQHV